jgi:hypothetical protein
MVLEEVVAGRLATDGLGVDGLAVGWSDTDAGVVDAGCSDEMAGTDPDPGVLEGAITDGAAGSFFAVWVVPECPPI